MTDVTPIDRAAPRTEAGRRLIQYAPIVLPDWPWLHDKVLAIEAEARQQVVEQISNRDLLLEFGQYLHNSETRLSMVTERDPDEYAWLVDRFLDQLGEAHRGD